MNPRDITGLMLMDFINALYSNPKSRVVRSSARQRSIKTVKNVVGTLSTFLDWCCDRAFLDANPAQESRFREQYRRYLKGRKPKQEFTESIKTKALKPDEVRTLLCTAHEWNKEDAIAMECLIHTGLRLGECAALTWKDLLDTDDFGRPLPAPGFHVHRTRDCHTTTVQNRPKWGSCGFVECNSRMQDLMEWWRAEAPRRGYAVTPEAPIFPCVVRNPLAFSDRIARLCQKAGIKTVRAHAMRHTSITFQVLGGNSLCEVQKVARHKTSYMTEAYFDATQLPTHGVTEAVVRLLEGNSLSSQPSAPPPAANVVPMRRKHA